MRADKHRIELAMARECLTVRELAERANLPRQTLNGVIGGRNAWPATLGKIARALGVDVEELLEVK